MAELLKDRYFTKQFIEKLASKIAKKYPDFDPKKFQKLVFDETWLAKELKDRMRHLALCLGETLPKEYAAAITILKKTAPDFNDFDAMLFPDFVEVYGLDDWELSLDALGFFTKYSSSEFAIRPFLLKDPQDVMRRMVEWAKDENLHIRRFASEGCRPRLPWAMAIPAFKKDPTPVLAVLELLKKDESDYVRRSVANNLNDISKDHPDLVLDVCEKWHGQHKHTDWIVKHACRGLLKSGNRRAMFLFGFGDPAHVTVDNLELSKRKLPIGDQLQFSFDVKSSRGSLKKLRVEYAIHFKKATGKSGMKVFKITENSYDKNTASFSAKHSFKDLSTRKHYPGEHKIAIIINGVQKVTKIFELTY